MSENKIQDLKSEYEKNSATAERLAHLILGGLVVEIAAAFILQKPPLEATLTILSTALILVGVWGEIVFERRARAAGDRMVAEANAKAAEADLKLANLRALRAPVLKAKGASVTEALRSFTNITFDAGIGPNDKDVEDCLWELEPLLLNAGWQQLPWRYPDGRIGGIPRGHSNRPLVGPDVPAFNVVIQIHPGQESSLGAAAEALATALTGIGVDASVLPFNIHNGNRAAMHVLVGPKR